MATLLKGLPVAKKLTELLVGKVELLRQAGVVPTLAIVRVGERDDDLSYERGAKKRCDAIDIAVKSFVLPEDCTQADLREVIDAVNADDAIHGCLMFRPLPSHLDEAAACDAFDPAKDMDCATN